MVVQLPAQASSLPRRLLHPDLGFAHLQPIGAVTGPHSTLVTVSGPTTSWGARLGIGVHKVPCQGDCKLLRAAGLTALLGDVVNLQGIAQHHI
jgi:hypothetical protein